MIFIAIILSACASSTREEQRIHTSAFITDVWPQMLGGLPPDAPPRRGTPEYDAWRASQSSQEK
jgi:hypothetical protein